MRGLDIVFVVSFLFFNTNAGITPLLKSFGHGMYSARQHYGLALYKSMNYYYVFNVNTFHYA